jgi:hypothetical protein
MALRVRVIQALAGSLSSTFWARKAIDMDEAPMLAAPPPTAQPRAYATSSVDAEASKSMRKAHAKAIESGNRLVSNFSNPCQRNRVSLAATKGH